MIDFVTALAKPDEEVGPEPKPKGVSDPAHLAGQASQKTKTAKSFVEVMKEIGNG